MIRSKSCPRCQGDMMLEEYLGEAEIVCLQCGHPVGDGAGEACLRAGNRPPSSGARQKAA